ncbi:MAG: hypothetical protein JNK89_01835 [Saprospiraceae bacterium]|nr:hypothetical protein [Saprospiraceae bacterium]
MTPLLRKIACCSLVLCCCTTLPAQISTITPYTPEGLEALQPLRASTPDAVACAGGYCYAFSRYDGASYRPPGGDWAPLRMADSMEVVYGLADAGDAVLVQTLRIDYGFPGYNFRYRIYRSEKDTAAFQLALDLTLTDQEGLDSERYGQFRVVDDQLCYFSLEISSGISTGPFKNFVSEDGGVSWKALSFKKNSLATACRVGDLYVHFDEGTGIFNPEPDSFYWSLTPEFTGYNATRAPLPSCYPLALEARQDTLFFFNGNDSLVYFSAFGGLDWQSRSLPPDAALNDVLWRQGRWFFATNAGLFSAAEPDQDWTPIYQYQDCFHPIAVRLYAPEPDALPWLSGAGSALLRPLDAQGDAWADFSKGLPGEGTQSFQAAGDTLYSSFAYACFQTADGLDWQPLRSPGLQGAGWLEARSIFRHQDRLFATGRIGDYFDDISAIFTKPDGGDWALVDTVHNEGYEFGLSASATSLYWHNYQTIRRSTDLGQNWETLPLPPGATFPRLLAYGDTLFVVNYSPNQLWRSTDLGQSWQALPMPALTGYFSLLRQGDRLVLVADRLVTWASADRGQSWQQTNLGINSTLYSVGYDVLDGMLVAHLSSSQLTYYRGVMLSLDAGAHWLKLRLPESWESNTYYGFARFRDHFYFGHHLTGNWRFPDRLVLQKLDEITPKVSVHTPFTDPPLRVQPNPAGSETWLLAGQGVTLPLRWQLFDLQGRLLRDGWMEQPECRIDLSGLAPGMYAVHIPGSAWRAVPLVVR